MYIMSLTHSVHMEMFGGHSAEGQQMSFYFYTEKI